MALTRGLEKIGFERQYETVDDRGQAKAVGPDNNPTM